MCLTPGASALGTSAVGGIGSAVGSIFAAQDQQTALNLQARISQINAATAQDNARAATQSGNQAITQEEYQTGMLRNRQQTAMAANGVEIGQGSSGRVLASTQILGAMDANTIRQNAARAAAGYQTQATNFSNQALMSSTAASAISPFVSGLSSLATASGTVSNQWLNFTRTGVPVGFTGGSVPAIGSSGGSWYDPNNPGA